MGRGKLKDLSFSRSGEQLLTIATRDDCRVLWDELNEAEIVFTIKKYSKRRSLDANAYAWVLMDKLATVTRIEKTEIYRSFIRNIGGNCETVCVLDSAVEKLRRAGSTTALVG